jgi:hypothetical protein
MKVAFLLILGCAAAAAGQPAEKPDISGTWKLGSSASDSAKVIVIQQGVDEINIRQVDSSGKVQTDMKCSTRGVECPVKINGDAAKVTYYFNGPTLVELVWRGKNVTKTRRTLSPDGEKLTVEVTSMNPPGDPEKFEFVKASEVATR